MHDLLLQALTSVADVYLLAALADERLGFPSTTDLRVFIPDIHLISERRRIEGGYRFASNHTDLLTDVLKAVRKLKVDAAAEGKTLVLYQMGDFLDLWRESADPDQRVEVAARITDDHEALVGAFLDRRLRARFLLGNHDMDLYRWEPYRAWERRYFLPDDDLQAPSLIALHGDVFDWIETFGPDATQRVLVYLFAPHLSPNDYALGEMVRLVKKSHGNRKYRNSIQLAEPADVGAMTPVPEGAIPPRFNLRVAGEATEKQVRFLAAARERCLLARQRWGLDLRAAVIGHTHNARIAIHEQGGDLFTLIDTGAWIENCIGPDGQPMPNAQVTALSGNEVRIYQLAP